MAYEHVGVFSFKQKGVTVSSRKMRWNSFFAKITQWTTWPFLFIFFHLFFRLSIVGQGNFSKVKPPFIIVANHVGMYDSFLFRLLVGMRGTHLPLHFMAVRTFRWKFLNLLKILGIVDLVYFLFGVFTVTPGEGIGKGLQGARRIIAHGNVVVMYAEGGINKEDRVAPFKKGAAVLAIETGVSVLPISFRLTEKNRLRPALCARIGEPLKVDHLDIEQATMVLHNAVSTLFTHH